jgi:hypothetical protein
MVQGTQVTKGGAAFANAEMAMAGGKLDSFCMLSRRGPPTTAPPGRGGSTLASNRTRQL